MTEIEPQQVAYVVARRARDSAGARSALDGLQGALRVLNTHRRNRKSARRCFHDRRLESFNRRQEQKEQSDAHQEKRELSWSNKATLLSATKSFELTNL